MRKQFRYLFAQVFIRGTAGLFLGLRVSGQANVPADGPFLIAANHKSYLDPPILGACVDRQIRYFAKKELFDIPLFGGIIRWFGALPVNRAGFDRKSVSLALEVLSRGEGLVVFPEGTRIRRPGLAEPREGIGLLALRSGAPIVPACIVSTWEPRRTLFRRIPIQIRLGAPLHFEKMAPGREAREHYPRIAAAVMEAIRGLQEADAGAGRTARSAPS
jgi:1-acyl-sn-glycerol-3-phosphate acyltransferase